MVKPGMRFTFMDENTENLWYFVVSGDVRIDDDKLEDAIQAWVDDNKLEYEYGVHDSCWYDGDIWGYSSYEVPEERFPELMEKWRKFWEGLGFRTGPVRNTFNDRFGNYKGC